MCERKLNEDFICIWLPARWFVYLKCFLYFSVGTFTIICLWQKKNIEAAFTQSSKSDFDLKRWIYTQCMKYFNGISIFEEFLIIWATYDHILISSFSAILIQTMKFPPLLHVSNPFFYFGDLYWNAYPEPNFNRMTMKSCRHTKNMSQNNN